MEEKLLNTEKCNPAFWASKPGFEHIVMSTILNKIARLQYPENGFMQPCFYTQANLSVID